MWSCIESADFMLGNSLFDAVKLSKNPDLDKYLISDIVLDLMYAEVFRYLLVVGLVKT